MRESDNTSAENVLPKHGNQKKDPSSQQEKLPLGVNSIINGTISILFRHIGRVFLIGLLPLFLSQLAYEFLPTPNFAYLSSRELFSPNTATTITILNAVFQIAIHAVTFAFLVQLAYDANLERSVKIRRYIQPALTSVFFLSVLTIVLGVIFLGSVITITILTQKLGQVIFLAIPACFALLLWIMAVFSVTASVVVIEQVSFRGLGRSRALTRNYRWAIAGTLFLTFVIVSLLQYVFTFLFKLVGEAGSLIPASIFFSAFGSLSLSFVSILITLFYSRLREIKEGIGVGRIDTVFD